MNQSIVPYTVLTVTLCLAYSILRRQVRWSGIPIFKNFLQFLVIHTIKSFGVVNKAEVEVVASSTSSNSLAFSMVQLILVIWSLVPLPFLNPA